MPKSIPADTKDIYQRVTDRIIADLEKGVVPWVKPWNSENLAGRVQMPLRSNGEPYRGINILNLWMTACAFGYASPYWFTFNQAKALGGNVRKGEKSTLVVLGKQMAKPETTDAGEEKQRMIFFMKGFSVFNADQIDNLPARFTEVSQEPITEIAERIEHAETFLTATQAEFRTGGNRAFYSPSSDHIQMPAFEAFRDAESYTATKAHELVHWTGAGSRLDRSFGNRGTDNYAKEELVAELGSAFLCAVLGITPEISEDHASYIGLWLKHLNNDKRLIVTAASAAQKAVDYLFALQPKAESVPADEISEDFDMPVAA